MSGKRHERRRVTNLPNLARAGKNAFNSAGRGPAAVREATDERAFDQVKAAHDFPRMFAPEASLVAGTIRQNITPYTPVKWGGGKGSRCQVLGAMRKVSGARCQVSEGGSGEQGAGGRGTIQGPRRKAQDPRPKTQSPLATTHCPPPTAHCPLPTAHRPLLTAHRPLPTIRVV